MTQSWTIKSMLDWSSDYFSKKNIETARLDSEILLSHLLNLKRLDLYLQFDRPLTDQELSAYKIFIKRRANLEPIAYIIGEKDFYDKTFKINSSVLIPRPDTEILIEATLKNFPDQNQSLKILDIGTGSGILSIILASQFPNSKILAIDISDQVLELAKENAQIHEVENQIEFKKLDILKENLSDNQKFDLIISNPPYIKKSVIKTLEDNVKKFEPMMALDGGNDGLDFYRKISTFKDHLQDRGKIILEIGFDQKDEVSQIFKLQNLDKIQIVKDLANQDRCLVIDY